MMHTLWNFRLLLVSPSIGSNHHHFVQADLIRVADHPGLMDGSVESARQVESLQRIARFSSQC